MTRTPNLFLIGAAKCGTTSLYHWLSGHPEVYMSPVKEPNYFAPDLRWEERAHVLRHPEDRDKYLALFSGAGEQQRRLGEGSVRYLFSNEAARLIHEMEPDARIVVSLRNPVDMVFSMYLHRRARGSEDITDFESAIAADDDRRAGRRIPAGTNPHLGAYRDRARFGEQLSRWFEAFGRERIHVIVFEQMVADPASEFRRLLEFLEVDAGYQPDSYRAHNPAHAARARGLRALSGRRAPQALFWGPLARVIGDARSRELAGAFRHSRLFHRTAERPKMSPGTRARLQAEFMPDVRETSKLVGRDLVGAWFSNDATSSPAAEAFDQDD